MEKYKTDSIYFREPQLIKFLEKRLIELPFKWILCVMCFLCMVPSGRAQFFTESFMVGGADANVSIQDVLIDDNTTYVYGTFTSAFEIDDFSLSHIGDGDVFLLKRVNDETEWVFFGGSAGNDMVANIALDESKNVFITGSFSNEAQFGDLTLTTSGSSRAIYVLGLSQEGELLEHHVVNGTGQKDVAAIVLLDDEIYLGGGFGDTLFIDDVRAVASANKDIYLLKLESDNDPAWISNFGISGQNDAVDFSWSEAGAQFIISGQFSDSISVAEDSIQTNTFDEDLFLAAFFIDGEGRYIRKLGAQFEDFNEAHATDEDGNIYLTGNYRGIIRFEDGSEINTGGIANSDSYLIKCNVLGDKIWARTLGNAGQEFGTDLIIQDDDIYWSGFHNQAYTIDGITFAQPDGSLAGAFAIYDTEDGTLEANLIIQSSSIVVPLGLVKSPTGVDIFGDFSGETSFDQVFNVGDNFAGFSAQISLTPVSTSDLENLPELSVYPNPTSDMVYLSFDEVPQDIQLYQQSGILIYRSLSPDLMHEVDLSNVPDGIYFWTSSDGRSGKIIKNRVPN